MFEPLPYKEGPVIYYLAPDYDEPSWGNALLYSHVEMLCKNNFQAAIIHHKRPYRYNWFKSNVKVVYLNNPGFKVQKEDILVVPEANVKDEIVSAVDCKKIVFVQNAFIMLIKSETAYNYSDFGYERAIVTMPHMKEIIENHFGVDADIVPPTIAEYFFIDKSELNTKQRAKQIVLFPKWLYVERGHIDYKILDNMLEKYFPNSARKGRFSKYLPKRKNNGWEVVKLVDKSHKEVSKIMKNAAFFINVNTFEGFNVTVAEAMAAGCIPICYDAYGGADYLQNNINAFVFNNNHIYSLLDKILDLVKDYDSVQDQLARMRENAYRTALEYTAETAENALVDFYKTIY